MIYIIEESWRYPDETDHSYWREAFYNKEAALIKAKELADSEERLFKSIKKEYETITINNGFFVETTDHKFEYTVNVVNIGEKNNAVDIYEVSKVYDFIFYKYKKFISNVKQEPDFVEVSIKWKDDNTSERTIIALNDKHDDLVTFRVRNLLELTFLFFDWSKEDFICEHIFNINFGVWE